MALPITQHPLHDFIIPSSKKKIKMRPMLVREEKVLLHAKQSKDDTDIFNAVFQIVSLCIMDSNFNMSSLTLFDLEYLFLKLRAVSVDSIAPLIMIDKEDKIEYSFDIDLLQVEVKFPDKIDNKFAVTETSGFVLKYPSAILYRDKDFLNNTTEDNIVDMLIPKCLESIYEDDKMYMAESIKKDELQAYIDNLPIPVYNKVKEFFANMPKIYHEVNYTNQKGTQRQYKLETLNDFFAWR